MWQKYRPAIMLYEFLPYVGNLISFFMLSSALNLNYVNEMTIYKTDEAGDRQETIQTLEGTPKIWRIIYQVFFQILCLFFIINYFWREIKQYNSVGHLAYLSSFWNIWGFVA